MNRSSFATLKDVDTAPGDDAPKPATDALRRETRRVGEDIGRLPELAKHAAKEQWDHGRSKMSTTWERGADRWNATTEKVGDTVRSRPWTTLATVAAVGAGLGAAVGAWFARKR